MDTDAGGVPVIANLPMGGGAVSGPGAGKLHVQWGVGNELRVCRVQGSVGAASGANTDDSGISHGAAYVVQWYALARRGGNVPSLVPGNPSSPGTPPHRHPPRSSIHRQP